MYAMITGLNYAAGKTPTVLLGLSRQPTQPTGKAQRGLRFPVLNAGISLLTICGKTGMDYDNELFCTPSEDRKTVTLTIKSVTPIGVREMVRLLALFIKHQLEENGITYDDAAIKPLYRVKKLE